MKRSSSCFAACLALSTSALLIGCSTVSPVPEASSAHSRLYQPRILRLEAGQVIATKDGTYLPQQDEMWHSPQAFEDVETKLLNALAALDQNRNRAR